jgi:ferredoxin
MGNSARCNLCGYCVKNCPNDSITITVRPPSKELWFISKPKFEESFLAIIIMGIVFVQNITMLEIWDQAQIWLENVLGTHEYAITFTVTFLVAMVIPVGLLYISSWAAGKSNAQSTQMNFARFGYALIPLDLAAHMAHNLFHLLAEGKSILFTGMAVFNINIPKQSTAFFSVGTIQILQYTLLVIGAFGSIYTAYRIAKLQYSAEKIKGSALPFICLIIVLTIANIYFFMLPMMHRM